jgi:hypothetical protein
MRTQTRLISFLVLLLLSGCANVPKGVEVQPLLVDVHGHPIGCSWYCCDVPVEVTASKTAKSGSDSYSAAHIHDWSTDSVWGVSGDDYGIGTKLTFTFDCTSERYRKWNGPLGIDSFSIINGFARSSELWAAKSRVKRFKVAFNGQNFGTVDVADTAQAQVVKLPRLAFRLGKENRLVLTIADVYRGPTRETFIADLVFDGFGVH